MIPPDKADEFRALVNSKVDEIDGWIQRERAAIEPQAKAPSQAAAPIAPEVAPKEIQSAVPAQPAIEAPAADAEGQKDMPDANAAPPSAIPTESSNSQSAPNSQRRARSPRHERNARNANECGERRAAKTRRQESARRQASCEGSRQKSEAEAQAEARRTPSQS